MDDQTKMQVDIATIQKDISYIKETLGNNVRDHEKRLRLVEQHIWKAIGASAIIAGLISTILALIIK